MIKRSGKKVATGYQRTPGGCRKAVCNFDEETFEEVKQLAIEEGTSFAEEVRTLVTIGLETLKGEK